MTDRQTIVFYWSMERHLATLIQQVMWKKAERLAAEAMREEDPRLAYDKARAAAHNAFIAVPRIGENKTCVSK